VLMRGSAYGATIATSVWTTARAHISHIAHGPFFSLEGTVTSISPVLAFVPNAASPESTKLGIIGPIPSRAAPPVRVQIAVYPPPFQPPANPGLTLI
jgi:hypothetical protein